MFRACPVPGSVQGWPGLGAAWKGWSCGREWNKMNFKVLPSQPLPWVWAGLNYLLWEESRGWARPGPSRPFTPGLCFRFVLSLSSQMSSPGLKLLWGCAGRAMWAVQAGAEAITGALVAALEAPARQVRSLSSVQRQTQFTPLKNTNQGARDHSSQK